MSASPAPLLSHTSVYERGVPYPERWLLVLHGILGTKTNWRVIVRRVLAANPTWGAVLVDLRNHGQSRSFVAPHTIAACVEDLVRLASSLDLRVDAVLGHSFGGKVALAYARAVQGALDRVVVVDSTPGERAGAHGSEHTVRVVELLAELRGVFSTREEFVTELLARGQTREVATWLAMNLVRVGEHGGFRFGVDLEAVRAMLDDYLVQDLWDVVEQPPGRVCIDLLVGDASPVVDRADRARLAVIARAWPERVRLHVVEHAGHWVHVDQPDATVALLVEALRTVPAVP